VARGAESILSRMGLQRRQSIARPLLWFAAGATVAAGDATKTAVAAVHSPATNAERTGRDGFDAKTDHV